MEAYQRAIREASAEFSFEPAPRLDLKAVTLDMVRDMLDSAEEYTVATYMHETLKADNSAARSKVPGHIMDLSAIKQLGRMANYPAVVAVGPGGAGVWIPQVRWAIASLQVMLAKQLCLRPTLPIMGPMSDWAYTCAGVAGIRASAWDFLQWVPSVRVIPLKALDLETAVVSANSPGRVIAKYLSEIGIPTLDSSHVALAHYAAEHWSDIFLDSMRTSKLSPTEAARQMRVGALAGAQHGNEPVRMALNNDTVVLAIRLAAVEAIPHHVRNTVVSVLKATTS
jgi:hypothetical protein